MSSIYSVLRVNPQIKQIVAAGRSYYHSTLGRPQLQNIFGSATLLIQYEDPLCRNGVVPRRDFRFFGEIAGEIYDFWCWCHLPVWKLR